MSDRELLERAAKAAGLELQIDYSGEIWALAVDDHPEQGVRWTPLVDDGDALRLAVRIGISIDLNDDIQVVTADGNQSSVFPSGIAVEHYCSDKYAATRRAIVRAAAEIGKVMP